MRHLSVSLPILTALLAVALGRAAADEKADPIDRFMQELVEITPGEGEFPPLELDGQPAAAFRVSRFEVTQELYEAVMGSNPSRWTGPRNSVEMVSWADATEFCDKLTAALRQRKKLGANEAVRLPTERQWQYLCRAGTKTAYSFGDDASQLGDYCWFTGNAAGNDPPVGAKKGNPWGLYDMHGYVWEWCADAVGDDGARRVLRGGAWTSTAAECRCDSRKLVAPDTLGPDIGFRCVIVPEGTGS